MANGFRCAVEMSGVILFAAAVWTFLLPVMIFLAVKLTLARYSDGHV